MAALKTATDHLVQGGSFCTKVYRSTDYNALMWVFQQLFEDVQAMKPNSSRSQSSEIFIICLKYTAPRTIDPKLLDPNHVFQEVKDPGLQTVDVLHKKYDKLNKRHRTGYDNDVGVSLRSTVTVQDFLYSKDPVRLLTDHNEIHFVEADEEIQGHPATTKEICQCLGDLRVLAKLDFKKLLKWRDVMRERFPKTAATTVDGEGDDTTTEKGSRRSAIPTTDMIEEAIAKELEDMTHGAEAAERKTKKKLRSKAARERQRQALGINNNAFGDAEDTELFALDDALLERDLDDLNDVDLEDDHNTSNRHLYAEVVEREEVGVRRPAEAIFLPDEGDGEFLERELEEQYERFVAGKRVAKERNLGEEEMIKKDLKVRVEVKLGVAVSMFIT